MLAGHALAAAGLANGDTIRAIGVLSRIENGLLDARWSTIQRISAALATTEQPRPRSLANGGKVTEIPAAPRTRWQPKQRTTEIAREKK